MDEQVTRYDSLTLDLEFVTASSTFRALLARGSPFVTMEYEGATPSISSPVGLESLSEVGTYSKAVPQKPLCVDLIESLCVTHDPCRWRRLPKT